MRTKKSIYNNLAAAILQITILIFGLITPRLMISTYGSELNGLVSSTKQMVSYLRYLELGISAALVYTLYKPLVNKNYTLINPLVTRAKKEYEKISLGYFIGVILLSLVYPLMLSEEIGYGYVIIMVFIIGIYGSLDFYTLSKYRVLLQADQRNYVVDLITTVTIIFQNVTSIILIIFNQSIFIVVFVPVIFLPVRSVLLNKYLHKKYPSIDYSTKPSEVKLEKRKDAFLSGLSNALNVSLPIVIVSMLVSLEMASVFSVYSMVFMGLTGLMSVFTTGMAAAFGNIYAKNEIKTAIQSNDYFEFLLYGILAILYSGALALIIPFVKIYMEDVADINYIYPMIGLLFTIWSVIHNTRIPNQTIISATGNWRMGRTTYILQMILLVVCTVVLGYLFGIYGILIGMIIASLYKTISVMYISNKKILAISNKTSILRLIRIFVIIFLTNLPLILGTINIDVNTLLEWMVAAVFVVIWSTTITVIINLTFDWKTAQGFYKRYIKSIFKRK